VVEHASEPQLFQESVVAPLAPDLFIPQIIRLPGLPPPLGSKIEPHCVGILFGDNRLREDVLKLDHPPGLCLPLRPVQVGDPIFLGFSPLIAVTRQIDDPVDLPEVKLERWQCWSLGRIFVLLDITSCARD